MAESTYERMERYRCERDDLQAALKDQTKTEERLRQERDDHKQTEERLRQERDQWKEKYETLIKDFREGRTPRLRDKRRTHRGRRHNAKFGKRSTSAPA